MSCWVMGPGVPEELARDMSSADMPKEPYRIIGTPCWVASWPGRSECMREGTTRVQSQRRGTGPANAE